MWAQLMTHIIEHLQEQLPTVTVQRRLSAVTPDSPTVTVGRGASTPGARPNAPFNTGRDQLEVECWVCNDDPAQADLALDTLEQQVQQALGKIPKLDGVDLAISIGAVSPDNEMFYPSRGSQTLIDISWKNRRT